MGKDRPDGKAMSPEGFQSRDSHIVVRKHHGIHERLFAA